MKVNNISGNTNSHYMNMSGKSLRGVLTFFKKPVQVADTLAVKTQNPPKASFWDRIFDWCADLNFEEQDVKELKQAINGLHQSM